MTVVILQNMYHYWFGILLVCKTIAAVNTAAIDRWELRFALHKTLETALISPLNLFKLSEVFFPRSHDVTISPVSVQVTYNLTCQEPANCSLQTEDVCSDEGHIASYFWTSLPINRTDRFTFSILESFSQQHFDRAVPLVEMSLDVKSLPCGTNRQDVRDELLCISAMLKAYAKEQGVPPPNSNLKGFVSDYGTLPRGRGIGPSFQTFTNLSNILLHCLILLTFPSYYIYKALYKFGKKSPIYGAYCAMVLFSFDLFFVIILHYEKDVIKEPLLIAFLSLEFISSLLMACASAYIFKVTRPTEVLPIPLVSITKECFEIWEYVFKKCCTMTARVTLKLCTAIAMWFPVAFLHVLLYSIIPDRVEVLLTSPLETFIELVFYFLLAVCFFVALYLPFHIEKPRCCCTRKLALENCVYIIKLLNIGVLIAFIFIVAFSTRYVALILSQSQDSDARVLIAVLPSIGVAIVVALRWRYVKKFVKTKLHPQEDTKQSNPKTDAKELLTQILKLLQKLDTNSQH